MGFGHVHDLCALGFGHCEMDSAGRFAQICLDSSMSKSVLYIVGLSGMPRRREAAERSEGVRESPFIGHFTRFWAVLSRSI